MSGWRLRAEGAFRDRRGSTVEHRRVHHSTGGGQSYEDIFPWQVAFATHEVLAELGIADIINKPVDEPALARELNPYRGPW